MHASRRPAPHGVGGFQDMDRTFLALPDVRQYNSCRYNLGDAAGITVWQAMVPVGLVSLQGVGGRHMVGEGGVASSPSGEVFPYHWWRAGGACAGVCVQWEAAQPVRRLPSFSVVLFAGWRFVPCRVVFVVPGRHPAALSVFGRSSQHR